MNLESIDVTELFMLLIFIITIFSIIWIITSDNKCDKYDVDSLCFDINYRCEIECKSYDLNFSGNVDGCTCDCETANVSLCSGFIYPK